MIDVNIMCDDVAMDTMGARLRHARENADFSSARKAAIKFGWPPSTYAAHENGQNDFSPDVAATYAKALKTNAAWLLTGEGEPGRMTRRPALVPSFDPDAPDDTPDPDAEPSGANFPPDAIKELAAKPGMGSGQTVETSYVRDGDQVVQRDAILDDYWRLPPDFIRGDLKTSVTNLLVVNCRGDSMEPTLRAGDRLVVDTSDKQPSGDRIFAIRDQLGEIVVKRLRLVGRDPIRIQVVSDNPTVDNIEQALEDVPIVGRVVAGLKLF